MPYLIKDKIEFLSEASKILSSSLDYNVTLASIAKLVVENLADFCMIDILENNDLHRVVVKTANRKEQNEAEKFYGFPPDPKNKKAIYDAAKAKHPIIIKKVTRSWLKSVSRIEEERKLVEKLAHVSYIFSPLVSRARVVGVMTIGSKSVNYDEEDALFIQEIANRAGITIDKAQLYKEAQDAIQTRDEFLAIASHELRTPLTSILLNLQLVLRKIRRTPIEKLNIEKVTEMIEYSEVQSFKLARLINDLLNVSVVSSGRLKIEKEETNFLDTLQGVLNKYQSQLQKEKIQILFKNKHTLSGFWDKVRLEQVVSNLISNAIKYGNKKPITINVEKDGNFLKFEVSDKGIGIEKKSISHVFDKFSRAVSPREYKGLGVGLYISKQIIEAHGGRMEVDSRKNRGSTFRVFLPL